MSVPGASASWECPILHVDMDAFYASVAIRDRPELQDVPVVVGGGHRGVVLSANYRGPRLRRPLGDADDPGPAAVPERGGGLARASRPSSVVSRSVMETFRQVTPLVEVLSLDEAFLDVSGAVRRLGSPYAIAEQLRARIYDEQGITCSVGMAATVAVAKLASRRAKPDGIVVVPPSAVTTFLHPLDVGELWGVGEKTTRAAAPARPASPSATSRTPRWPRCSGRVGAHLATQLHQLAWGEDRRVVTARRGSDEPDKSMGADETFGRDTDDRAVVLRELLRLSAKVAGRMRAARVAGRTVTLKVRFADFTTITRSRTLGEATDVTQEIYRDRGRPVRRARAAARPDPAGGGAGRGAGARGPRCSASWCSGSASAAGRRPTGPSTGRRAVRGRRGPAGHPARERPRLSRRRSSDGVAAAAQASGHGSGPGSVGGPRAAVAGASGG